MAEKIEYQYGDIVGSNNIVFLQEVEKKSKRRRAIFQCHCGKKFESAIISIRLNKVTSCKCWKTKNTRKHGFAIYKNKKRPPEYTAWDHMKQRCNNPKNKRYHDYGGRGITVCDRWTNPETGFQNFLEDMGERPSPVHSLDRMNNEGNYEPSNCKWSTRIEQANNKRSNKDYKSKYN